MKRLIRYFLPFWGIFTIVIISVHAQCVIPDNLIYKRNAYYLNGMNIPYAGCVEGYVHNPLVDLGGGRLACCMLGTYEISTGDTSVSWGHMYVAYVQGVLENGREVGVWKLYGKEGQLIGICDFSLEKRQVDVTYFAHDYPIAKGVMFYNRKKVVMWKYSQLERDFSIHKKYPCLPRPKYDCFPRSEESSFTIPPQKK